jgi:hypothetical protein
MNQTPKQFFEFFFVFNYPDLTSTSPKNLKEKEKEIPPYIGNYN